MSLVADYAAAQMTPSLELVMGLKDSVASMQEAMMSIQAMQQTRDTVVRRG
jgi:flagellar hook-basal body complex protein FliE